MTHGGSTLQGMAHTNYSYTRLYYSLGRNYVALLHCLCSIQTKQSLAYAIYRPIGPMYRGGCGGGGGVSLGGPGFCNAERQDHKSVGLHTDSVGPM